MASGNLKINISVRWWVRPYLRTLAAMCRLTDCHPDERAVGRFVMSYGLKVVSAK